MAKVENAGHQHFLTMFSTLSEKKLSSANAVNLDKAKILLSGKELTLS